jgi:ABC-type spermidine/putrescine transport system permease subunit II
VKLLTGLVLAALLLPLVLSIAVSFAPSRYLELPRDGLTLAWYRQFFDGPAWLQALRNSIAIAALTAAVSVATALATAVALVKYHFRWRGICEKALLLPMVLPGVALAVGMLALVRMTPLWGSHLSLVVAHSVMAIPVCYLVLRASLSQMNPDLEAAARGLGAGSWQVFRFITLPLVLPAVLAATLFAVVISLNEVTLSLFLATRYTATLPFVIWPNLRFAITPLVAAASVVLLVLSLPALAATAWWLRPRTSQPVKEARQPFPS